MDPISFAADTAWESRFNEYLRSHSLALESFRSLIDAGIPQDWLIQILHAYADPLVRENAQSLHRQTALPSIKEVDHTLKALGKASDALKSLAGNNSVPAWTRDHHFNLRSSLAQHLCAYEEALREVRQELVRLASEKGEGASEELLAGMVEALTDITGQPNWGDLAYLIEAAYFGHDRKFEADRDTIRKRYGRFVRNFPRLHESWVGLDWKCFFGIEEKAEVRTELTPHEQMDHFMRRFIDEGPGRRSTKPRHAKIHT
jgi:hypothetical protein